MVTDFAILGGLSLIYLGMLTTIITLARIFVEEQRTTDLEHRRSAFGPIPFAENSLTA
jgi:hypothetical protein